MAMSAQDDRKSGPLAHGSTATPAEDSAREADPAVVPPADKVRIAEEASREEDA